MVFEGGCPGSYQVTHQPFVPTSSALGQSYESHGHEMVRKLSTTRSNFLYQEFRPHLPISDLSLALIAPCVLCCSVFFIISCSIKRYCHVEITWEGISKSVRNIRFSFWGFGVSSRAWIFRPPHFVPIGVVESGKEVAYQLQGRRSNSVFFYSLESGC